MDKLEIAYTVDLLNRLTESIETYLDDDRWDGIDTLHKEIKESNKLIKKYYKRMQAKVDIPHVPDCPAIDGFGCHCEELKTQNKQLRDQLKAACNKLMEVKL